MSKKKLTADERRTEAAEKLYKFIAAHPGDDETDPQSVLFYLAVLREITILHSDGDKINTADADYNRGYAAGIKAARDRVYIDTFADFCDDPGLLDAIEVALAEFMDTYEPTTDRETIQRQTVAIYDGIMVKVPRLDPRTGAAMIQTRIQALSRFGLMNDNVNRAIMSGVYNIKKADGQLTYDFHIDKRGTKERRRVPVVVGLSYMDGHTFKGRPMTGKLDAVFTAVSNIIFDCIYVAKLPPPYNITPEQIWRRMNGITDTKRTPNEKQKKEVCDMVDRLMFTRLTVDFSAEIKAHNLKIDDERLTGGHYDAAYLLGEKLTFYTVKGRTVTGYSFTTLPFLYAYNRALGRLVLTKSELLDVSDTVQTGKYVTDFKMYLLLEITRMYYPPNDSRYRPSTHILYDTIYHDRGVPTPAERTDREKYKNDESYAATVKRQASDDRKKIAAILDSWKAKKWIDDWKPLPKKGRVVPGVEIILNPDQKMAKAPELEGDM